MFDCYNLTANLKDSTVEAACIGAWATMHGAKLGAKAGIYTLMGGLATVVAGLLAYKAAIVPARLTQAQDQAKRRAYAVFMNTIVAQLKGDIDEQAQAVKQLRQQSKRNTKLDRIEFPRFSLPSELNAAEWQNHAMLGEAAILYMVNLSKRLGNLSTISVSRILYLDKRPGTLTFLVEFEGDTVRHISPEEVELLLETREDSLTLASDFCGKINELVQITYNGRPPPAWRMALLDLTQRISAASHRIKQRIFGSPVE